MDKNPKYISDKDMVSIANEVTIRSYKISKVSVQKLFHNMTAADYVALWMLSENVNHEDDNHKIYLKDIADMLKIPMGQVSRLVRALQERGLVVWKHDGKGDDGTYIQITDKGIHSAMDQQETLKSFYLNVIEKFGEDKFISLLTELKELEQIMDSEIKEGEK